MTATATTTTTTTMTTTLREWGRASLEKLREGTYACVDACMEIHARIGDG
eukprot:CAMPEP_0171552696 /NCGR_PEP_ID=MMETSP0960-20121227/8499_1 /TAXON_ID=87120 /ORGANISM="Aurantiochytrium limacinum, Strain ATCCMYA-1381" /LENGTH=49 /DNA_ID=CAMNT_0012102243 /DNA_START=580 /DNA_END=729 /DNA_ORIENTATION=+